MSPHFYSVPLMEENTAGPLSPLNLYGPATNCLQLSLEPLKSIDDIQLCASARDRAVSSPWRPGLVAHLPQSCTIAHPAPIRTRASYSRILDGEQDIAPRNAASTQYNMTAGCHDATKEDLPTSSTVVDSAQDKTSLSALHSPYHGTEDWVFSKGDTHHIPLPQTQTEQLAQEQPSGVNSASESLNAAMLQLLQLWHQRFYALDTEYRTAGRMQGSTDAPAHPRRSRGRRGAGKQKGRKGGRGAKQYDQGSEHEEYIYGRVIAITQRNRERGCVETLAVVGYPILVNKGEPKWVAIMDDRTDALRDQGRLGAAKKFAGFSVPEILIGEAKDQVVLESGITPRTTFPPDPVLYATPVGKIQSEKI
ncbi:uncharacterized protein FIBRA_08311 [Fibroporia radiculosa]|uniref:Uncharacterized protein n=1 Tax=Fibroporia radiculosa TaxID=599839 RepID=J4H538_9APHY|nr:uncharacterized protein FIBRA_08311 [Fibroporia radiculosa]CCM06064.1 predicted protein [Fibroporia radiculosa]